MKKKVKMILLIVIITTIGLITYSYFHIEGAEFKEVLQISETSEVIIKKYKLGDLGATDEQKVTLNSTQKEMLKSLFSESDFKRLLSSWVSYNDKDCYDIIITDNKQRIYIAISSIGGEYISSSSKFNGKHLRILNSQWKNKLDEIISLSNSMV